MQNDVGLKTLPRHRLSNKQEYQLRKMSSVKNIKCQERQLSVMSSSRYCKLSAKSTIHYNCQQWHLTTMSTIQYVSMKYCQDAK